MRRARIAAALLALAAPAIAPAADIARGAEVYERHCARCHGSGGTSTWPGAPNLARREGLLRPDAALVEGLRKGRGAKPAYQGLLSEADLYNVIAYSRTLAR